MPGGDSHENMQLDPQSRSSQSETRNGGAEEDHAFCNRLYRLYGPAAEDNRGSLAEGTQVFSVVDNHMDNAHHGEEAGSLVEDTLRDRGDTRGCGEWGLQNHAADGFYQSKIRLQAGCGVVRHDSGILSPSDPFGRT